MLKVLPSSGTKWRPIMKFILPPPGDEMNTNSRYFFNHTLSRDAVVLIFYGKMGFLSEKNNNLTHQQF